MMQALLAPFKLGPIELPNRIVVAPLTQMRTPCPAMFRVR